MHYKHRVPSTYMNWGTKNFSLASLANSVFCTPIMEFVEPPVWQLIENCGVVHVSLVWRASKQGASSQRSSCSQTRCYCTTPAGPVCPHCVAEVVHRTSVSAIIYDRRTTQNEM